MAKIYFNTRDDLTAIDIDTIAVVQANGNYSRIITSYKREIMLTSGITKIEKALEAIKEDKPRFIRLGRSLIVNHSFLQKIDLIKQVLILSCYGQEIRLNLSKTILKTYKEAITKSIKIRNHGNNITGN